MNKTQYERFQRAYDDHLDWCIDHRLIDRDTEDWLAMKASDLTYRLNKEELKVIDI